MLRKILIELPRWRKRVICQVVDIGCLCSGLLLAYLFRVGFSSFWSDYSNQWLLLCLLGSLITISVYTKFGLYNAVVRYTGQHMIFSVIQSTVLAGIILSATVFLLQIEQVPRSIIPLFSFFSIAFICASRYSARYWLSGYAIRDIVLSPFKQYRSGSHVRQGVPVAVYGAGTAGRQLVEALDKGRRYKPVAFIDDDKGLHGSTVIGRKVFHPDHLDSMLQLTELEEILLAIPSSSMARKIEVMKSLEPLGLPVKTMPELHEIASGKLPIQEVKAIDVGDLLGRECVAPDPDLLKLCIAEKAVMVTGAGGSIGSELCRQALKNSPERLVLFDHSEFNLYSLEEELLRAKHNLRLDVDLIPILGSVNDPERLHGVMKSYGVQTVYHAAAYKHVPIIERNIAEGIRNNVLGTVYSAQAAVVAGVERFVLVSTDKAVRPTNIMGASKRMSELALQALSNNTEVKLLHSERFGVAKSQFPMNTIFSMVRFGNVLDSSGSVVPRFREQIRSGGPITVTHPEITRYFMTIPEASELVIQAGALGHGGDVFVLDMGEPIKILDLARKMISLSGYTEKAESSLDGDIEIQFTGLRPGEKLYEELLIGENASGTCHPKINRAVEHCMSWDDYKIAVNGLLASINSHDYPLTQQLLMKYVSGYKPEPELVDLLCDLSEGEKENVKSSLFA